MIDEFGQYDADEESTDQGKAGHDERSHSDLFTSVLSAPRPDPVPSVLCGARG